MSGDLPDLPPVVELKEDAAVIWDNRISSILYTNGFFGKPLGLRKADPGELNRPLVLSLFELIYLNASSVIKVSHKQQLLETEELMTYANQYYEDFTPKYKIYEYLRKLGYVVRPGMKFGSDFVIYEEGPGIDHSKWVVHVEKDQKQLRAIEVVRAGRLAASVKKRYLIATLDNEGKPVFYGFDRVKI